MARIVQEYPFEAVLFPAGVFNLAYDYSFVDTVLPIARECNRAVPGMNIYAAGRIKHARSIVPYLRYSLHLPVDTDSISHLEEMVRAIKDAPPPFTSEEIAALMPEAPAITQSWDEGEFNRVQGYQKG